jgi:hypothetical protein
VQSGSHHWFENGKTMRGRNQIIMADSILHRAEKIEDMAQGLLIGAMEDFNLTKRFEMVLYKSKKRFQFKWIVAAVIFIVVLTITFNDLYGAGFPN